ncbi:MAG: hypothetical protein OEV91_09755 [Desulfobulbaceae bacterium]|nr:hypothetical protein [Desulfobulbaceae bacterium]
MKRFTTAELGMEYITRVEATSTGSACWLCEIRVDGRALIYSQAFPDDESDGNEKLSLAKAQKYRNKAVKRFVETGVIRLAPRKSKGGSKKTAKPDAAANHDRTHGRVARGGKSPADRPDGGGSGKATAKGRPTVAPPRRPVGPQADTDGWPDNMEKPCPYVSRMGKDNYRVLIYDDNGDKIFDESRPTLAAAVKLRDKVIAALSPEQRTLLAPDGPLSSWDKLKGKRKGLSAKLVDYEFDRLPEGITKRVAADDEVFFDAQYGIHQASFSATGEGARLALAKAMAWLEQQNPKYSKHGPTRAVEEPKRTPKK